jgi:hypothetical protein
MKPFWYEAEYLLQTTLTKARGQDDNGIDLLFTCRTVKVENCEPKGNLLGKNPLTAAMRNQDARPTLGLHTDLRISLGAIFDKYLKEAENRTKFNHELKNLTLIVLTDGWWDDIENKEEVKDQIVRLVQKLRGIVGDMRQRPVSIEFIQFGDDADATHRLWALDNHLKYDGIP